MSRLPKGYRSDPDDYVYRQHRELLLTGPPLLKQASLFPFRKGFICQGTWQECVACALKRAVQLWHCANGYGEQVMISDAFAYTIGRVEEFAGSDPDRPVPLEDTGSIPSLVLQASQQLGMVSERDYPGPSLPNFDPVVMFQRPPPDMLVKAYDARGLEFYNIEPGVGARTAIRECMVRRHPVIFSTFVDEAFEQNSGEVIGRIDGADPDGGLHMLCVLDATRDDHLTFDNWWRSEADNIVWGAEDGTGRMSWDLFESTVRRILAVRAAPLVGMS